MLIKKCFVKIILPGLLYATLGSMLNGQSLTDPGFENYSVISGGFDMPSSGPWEFTNNAGVVEPFSPNSSTAPLNTWSAVYSAYEGQQYASTYAGGDSIRQLVSFDTPGNYTISAYAAAPDGVVTIPPNGTLPLEDGEFTFTLGITTDIGALQTVPKGSSWNLYSANFTLDTPGNYWLGIQNTKTLSYFINYDSFTVHSVPEPQIFHSILIFGLIVAAIKARKKSA